ncbi:MAG TPA: YopX family protein [Rickettsiales bacterium]|nr:YopX family protein [Rickettsiales bacterium]
MNQKKNVERNELTSLHQNNDVATITSKRFIKNKEQIFPGVILGNIGNDNVDILGRKLILRHGCLVKPNKYDKEIFQRFPQYRFWNFKEQRMYYPNDIKSIEFGGGLKTKDNANFKIITTSNETYLNSEGVLMEYTHITDGKGNRLCEGDILRSGTEIFFLYYNPNESAFETKPFNKDVPFAIGMHFDRADGTEIIGNVYENYNIVNNKHSLEIARFYDFEKKELTKENKKYLLENDFAELIFKKDIFKPKTLMFKEKMNKS